MGDGSAERPFQRVSEALASAPSGAHLLIEAGLYEEPLHLDKPVRMQGAGGHVVIASSIQEGAAIQVDADALVQDLVIQGGRRGVFVHQGSVTLERVGLRGQPESAIDCGDRSCTLRDVALEASFATALGVTARGQVSIDSLHTRGPFKRALDLQTGAHLRGHDIDLEEATTGVHSEGATLELNELMVSDSRVAGLFVSEGSVRLREGGFARCDYAVLARDHAHLDFAGTVVVDAKQAGIALTVGASLELRDHVHVGAAKDGAITVDSSELNARDVLVRKPGPTGIRSRAGRVRASQLLVLDATQDGGDFGNAAFFFDADVQGIDWEAIRCEGPAVEAQLGQGRVHSLLVHPAGLAALALEHQGHFDVDGLTVLGGNGAGVACIEAGQGKLAWPRFEHMAGQPFLVDCSCHVSAKPAPAGLERCPNAPVAP
jgi:hypothetical protein